MYARDIASFATPVGRIRVEGDDRCLSSVRISDEEPTQRGTTGPVRTAAEQLAEWFAGERTDFDLPLLPAATPRGAELRAALVALPYGQTLGYGAFARLTGSSARAIGQLCARNPFPILVPCHRVLNADGSLGAYSAGAGPTTKSWLLAHEQRHLGAMR